MGTSTGFVSNSSGKHMFPAFNDIYRCSRANSWFVGPLCYNIMPKEQVLVHKGTGACRNNVFQTLEGGVDEAYMRHR